MSWECKDTSCKWYDGWGSEHSCSAGNDRWVKCKAKLEGYLVVEDEVELLWIGDPNFFGKILVRQEITILPADVPWGCMRIKDEVELSERK